MGALGHVARTLTTVTRPRLPHIRTLTTTLPHHAPESKIKPNMASSPTSPRVFGVVEKPYVDTKPWLSKRKEKLKEMTNYDTAMAAHLKERQFLVEKITESYWKDAKEMGEHQGKMWLASERLVKPEKALYMPNFHGVNLKNEQVDTTNLLQGRTSLVTFVFSRSGEPHVESFSRPFVRTYEGINVQENWLKSFLLKAFVPSIRKQIPESEHRNYILLYQNIERLRPPLGMTNQYIGYSFLVDAECKIRWGAHGIATEDEIKNMLGMARTLWIRAGGQAALESPQDDKTDKSNENNE